MSYPAPPDTLYKYRSLVGDAAKWTERIVLHNEIYFAPARSFNDPFDLRPNYSFEGTPEEHRADALRLLQQHNPGTPAPLLRMAAEKILTEALHPEKLKDTARRMYERSAEFTTQRLGVFCVTPRRDNILMWSHYADSHAGVCLEFSTACPALRELRQVIYTDDRVPINHMRDSPQLMVEKALLSKSTQWAYECEWRAIRYQQGPGSVEFEPKFLTGIVLGAQASPSTEAMVRAWVKDRSTPCTLYRTIVAQDRFELNIEPIA